MSPTVKASLGIAVTSISLAYVVYKVDIRQATVSFEDISLTAVIGIFAALSLNFLFVSFRLHRLMRHFGVSALFGTAIRANIAGAIASLYLFQILGSLLGRHFVLKQFGTAASLTAIITYYERIIVATVSGALCLLGLILLDHGSLLQSALTSIPKEEFWLTLAAAVIASLIFANTYFERDIFARLRKPQNAIRLLESSGLTLLGQLLNLAAFVVALKMLNVEASFVTLFAASAVVSFAASLPISANGWGVRELVALHVFGLLGVSPIDAVTVSVLIGLSTTVIVIAGYFFFSPHTVLVQQPSLPEVAISPETPLATTATVDFDKLIAWLLAHVVAILLFFQAPVQIGDTALTVNLADPVALMALLVFGLTVANSRQSKLWNVRHFHMWVLAMTFCLILGFLVGVHEFGITSWALTNRVAGWAVILGYMSAGALGVLVAGQQGLRRFCETLMVTASAVVVLQLLMRFGVTIGIPFEIDGNFEAFSGNRNALAFQLLIVIACGLAYSKLHLRQGGWLLWSFLLGILLLGIWSSLGRSALITGTVMLTIAYIFQIADRRTVLAALAVAVLGYYGFEFLHASFLWFYDAAGYEPGLQILIAGMPPPLVQSGDTQRFQSALDGLTLWRENPILGAGLGAYVRLGLGEHGLPLVIHSTPIWILAELGLIGGLVFGGFGAALLWSFRQNRKHPFSVQQKILLLTLLCFGLFGLVHEIFYQRIFWLVLGAAVAAPAVLKRKKGDKFDAVKAER